MTKRTYELKNLHQKDKLLQEQDVLKQLDELRRERDKYKRQCDEMLQFLKDYGLKWVGGDSGPNAPYKSPREKNNDKPEEAKEVGPN